MRKFLVSAVAAASALSIAAPAAAQWAPPVYNYQPYNYGYRFNGLNVARSMESRVQRLRNDIRNLQERRILSWQEGRNLDRQANNLQRRIYRASRNGIQPGEARTVENQIRNLEYRISREAHDWNGRPGHYGRGYGRGH
jgi:septal ring factor EnvC (AmiA/AmiB activator)